MRAAVIGLGVGEQHVKTYRGLQGVSVVAVCDSDPTKLADVAGRYGIPRRETGWRAVVEDPDIDIVSICSFDDGHAEQAIAALRAGKHVMVEKPICLFRHEQEALLRAVEDSGKRISSNLILRSEPRFAALRERIRAGELGRIFHVEGDYLHPILWKIVDGWRARLPFYSVVYGGGIHLIDLMRWLLGEDPVEAVGLATGIAATEAGGRIDDTATALLRFASGATGKCTTSLAVQRPKLHALAAFGTRGTFQNGLPDATYFFGENPVDARVDPVAYPSARKGDLIPDFVAAIRENREPVVGKIDVFRTMDVCMAVNRSIETGRIEKVGYLI